MDLGEWNKKLYGDRFMQKENYTRFDELLWKTFKIKSWPLFRDACAYHIPDLWREDVIKFIYKVRGGLGDRITFTQIKEKYCHLVVYYHPKDKEDEEAKRLIKEWVKECIESLIQKGLHPKGEKDEQGNK